MPCQKCHPESDIRKLTVQAYVLTVVPVWEEAVKAVVKVRRVYFAATARCGTIIGQNSVLNVVAMIGERKKSLCERTARRAQSVKSVEPLVTDSFIIVLLSPSTPRIGLTVRWVNRVLRLRRRKVVVKIKAAKVEAVVVERVAAVEKETESYVGQD